MKVSKIASVALLGAVISTSAYANLSGFRGAYNTANTKYLHQVGAYEVLMQSLESLKSVGYDALSKYDKDNATTGNNKIIKDAFDHIINLASQVSGIQSSDLNNTFLAKVTKDSADLASFYIQEGGSLATNTLKILFGAGDVSSAGTTLSTSDTSIKTTFTADHKADAIKLYNAIKAEAEKRLQAARTPYDTALLNYAGALKISDAQTDDKANLTNINFQKDAHQLLDAQVKEKTADLEKIKKDTATARAEIAKLQNMLKTDQTASQANNAQLEKVKAALKAANATLTNANNSGSNLEESNATLDDFKESNTHLTSLVIDTTFNNLVNGVDTALRAAKTALTAFDDLLGSKKVIDFYNEDRNQINTKVGALSAEVTASDALKKANEIKNAAAVAKLAQAQINSINKALEAANAAKTPEAKFEALKMAVSAGLAFDGKNGSSDPVKADNVNTYSPNGTNKGDIDTAITSLKSKATTATGDSGKLADLLKAAKTIVVVEAARLNAIANYLGLNGTSSSVAESFKDILDNNVVSSAITDGETSQVIALLNSEAKTVNDAVSSIKNTGAVSTVRLNNDLNTSTRLAKLSNPFNKDLALASAINEVSKNDSFASSDNGAVAAVIKEYTDRFNYDNNVWANIIGAKAKIKDGLSPETYGFSVGYDKAFDNVIVGGYATYAKSKADSNNISLKTDIYEFGAYTRAYIDQNEIDASLAFGFGKNKLERSLFNPIGGKILSQSGKFDTKYLQLNATYGYVFDLDNAFFVKPLVGLEFNTFKNDSFTESGDIPVKFGSVKQNTLLAKAGVELRKYVDGANYVYATPAIGTEVYKKKAEPSVSFVGASKNIDVKVDNKKKTYFMLNTGVEAKLTKDLSLNVNFGAKAASKEQYYNGTLGLRYSF